MTKPQNQRGTNRNDNEIPGEICIQIHKHIKRNELKATHYRGKQGKYLDARSNLIKMYQTFISDNPNLEGKAKYNFYYSYFEEHFECLRANSNECMRQVRKVSHEN